MTRMVRMAGALVVETVVDGCAAWFLAGDTKVPCDWGAARFVAPMDYDARRDRFVRLQTLDAPRLEGTQVVVGIGGEVAVRLLAARLMIERTGAVSERLWRLVVGDDEAEEPSGQSIDAAWLCAVPEPIWAIVRDAVLRCN